MLASALPLSGFVLIVGFALEYAARAFLTRHRRGVERRRYYQRYAERRFSIPKDSHAAAGREGRRPF
jgi:hypothetical protein